MNAVDPNFKPSEKSSSSQDRDGSAANEWTASDGARSSQESGDFALNRSISK